MNKKSQDTTVHPIKEVFRDQLDKFTIKFSSNPYKTEVEYDFKNKTKTIKHYTSGSGEHTDEIVAYSRFDELFDYLYDKVFPNNENIKKKSINSDINAAMATEPYYNMYVDFNTSRKISTLNSNWISDINYNTKLATWVLNGDILPSYWKELLNKLEINESILSEGVTYNFNESIYE